MGSGDLEEWVAPSPKPANVPDSALGAPNPVYFVRWISAIFAHEQLLGEVSFAVATILLVEDNTGVRGTVRRCLKSLGHHVVEAANGIEALTQLKAQTVDLVLTDVDMPEMDGIELIRSVRREMPEVPIMVITAVHEAIDVLERELGILHLLSKPFDFKDLSNALRQALE